MARGRILWLTAMAALVPMLGTRAAAAPCALDDLRWMAGVWRGGEAASPSEERWTIAPGGRLMGSSWVLHTDRPGGVVEASSIQQDGDQIALRIRHFSSDLAEAREEKTAPMVFLASQCGAQSAVFDGQGERTGEHMTYSRAGDTLTFVGDFIHQGKPLRVEIKLTRAGD